MFSPETMSTFFVASILLALAPGPDNIFVLTQSALQGTRAGISVTFGLMTGLLFHTTTVALGIAAIVKTSAVAFTALKLFGAAYLIYLAWKAFRTGAHKISQDTEGDLRLSKLYTRGVIMNITNPKVSIFFLAFLPQFTDPTKGAVVLQIMALGTLFMAATLLVFGSIASMSGWLSKWLRSSSQGQIILNRVAGCVFLGLAIKLATAKQ
ncbi:MAG: LysE family translocator [Verrucomicrobiota bacterium]